MVKRNTCVFISGKGSNLRNLIKKSREYVFPIKISLVVSNKSNAPGNIYAKRNSIPIVIINSKNRYFEKKIFYNLKKYNIKLICLAGYMKIISNKIVKKFEKKIINIHPSLLPKYKGLNTYTKVLKNREKKTGCTVHYVNNKLDDGDIILKKIFYINSNDNEITLKKKTQTMEYKAYPEALIKIFRNR